LSVDATPAPVMGLNNNLTPFQYAVFVLGMQDFWRELGAGTRDVVAAIDNLVVMINFCEDTEVKQTAKAKIREMVVGKPRTEWEAAELMKIADITQRCLRADAVIGSTSTPSSWTENADEWEAALAPDFEAE